MFNLFVLFLFSVSGVGLTQYLKRRFEMNAVRASALTILVGCALQFLLVKLFPQQAVFLNVSYLVCGASFCGMSSSGVLKNRLGVLLCAAVYTCIFTQSVSVFKGVGGALGTASCLAVLVCYGLLMFGKTISSLTRFSGLKNSDN